MSFWTVEDAGLQGEIKLPYENHPSERILFLPFSGFDFTVLLLVMLNAVANQN